MGHFDLLDAWLRWFDLTGNVSDSSQRPLYAGVVVYVLLFVLSIFVLFFIDR